MSEIQGAAGTGIIPTKTFYGQTANVGVGRLERENMNVRLAKSDKEIAACYPVMRELRPHIPEDEFVARIRSQEKNGYRLVLMEDGDAIVAVAGFRMGEYLARGRFLYVDDLVTFGKCRSQGYGAKLLPWLRETAIVESCQQMHLDSGIQREDAHRFYEREGVSKAGIHFAENLVPIGQGR